jgi:hypothetical protein
MKSAVLLAMASLMLAGCTTPYQPMGFTGGVEAQPITSDTYRIVSRGNGYTSSTAVQDYTLLKAAETTRDAGATHFVFISTADASKTEIGQTAGTTNTTYYGRTAVSTYTPGQVYSVNKPGQDSYIKIFKIPAGASAPPGAFSAAEIIANIGPRVTRPSS